LKAEREERRLLALHLVDVGRCHMKRKIKAVGGELLELETVVADLRHLINERTKRG
jgi:hypothetical protein